MKVHTNAKKIAVLDSPGPMMGVVFPFCHFHDGVRWFSCFGQLFYSFFARLRTCHILLLVPLTGEIDILQSCDSELM